MPKLGMEPIRREQIRRAAAQVIAKHGFDRATIKGVAVAANVSTGTINHYYENKSAVLIDAVIHVSDWFQSRTVDAIAREATAHGKLRALLRTTIDDNGKKSREGYAVWVWAMSEAIRSEKLRAVVRERRQMWQAIIEEVLRGLAQSSDIDSAALTDLAAEIDAYLHGLCVHRITGETNLDPGSIELSLMSMILTRMGRPTQPVSKLEMNG